MGGLLKVCVSNSSEDTLSNRPTVLPKTLCLQLYVSFADTLSGFLHFFRRHLVCSSTFLSKTLCLQFCSSIWHLVWCSTFFSEYILSTVLRFYMALCLPLYISSNDTLSIFFIFLHDTLSGVLHFFRRHILHTSTFLHGHPLISHVMMHYNMLNDAVWTSVVIWHRMIWDSAFCLWMWKDRPQEGIGSVAKCYCDIRLKEMMEITKPSARTANSHRHFEGKYLRIVGKYLLLTDRHNVTSLRHQSSAVLLSTPRISHC